MSYFDITGLMKRMAWIIAITLPLALWKLVDIAIWLYKHVDIAINLS
jgi:hypothetical protein